MDKKTALAIMLSQEELFVIMAYLGAKALLSLDNSALTELAADQYQLTMKVAERALIARGFLIPDGKGKFKLIDAVHALVGACAAPDTSLIIRRSLPERLTEEFLFHLSRKMVVLHTNPMTAMRQFIALPNKDAMIRSATSILELESIAKLDCPAAQLSEVVLIQIRELVHKGDTGTARNILLDAGWQAQTVEAYVASLEKPIFSETVIHVVHKPDGDGDVTGFTIFKAENGLWLLNQQAGQLSVEAAAAPDIVERLRKLVAG